MTLSTLRIPRAASMRASSTITNAAPSNARTQPSSSSLSSLAHIRVVVWDVDGTLADSASLGFDSTNAVLRDAGLAPITPAQYALGTKFTTPRRLAWHATGDEDHACGRELGDAFDARYVALVSDETAGFYPGIKPLVERLAVNGVRQGVLSNACGAYARAVIEANGIGALVSAVLGADDVPRAKPAPDGLLQAFRTIGDDVDARTTAYIGDAPSDGAAARAAGCVSIGVNWGSHDLSSADAFDVVFASVDELERAFFGE
jgi:phosphoglycolate phosphatase-like HAD superfamily hydrolase